MDDGTVSRGRADRWGRRLLYWLAVVAVSIVLVVCFVLLLESFDGSSLGAIAISRA